MGFKPKESGVKKQDMNPVWRGVGFVLLFIVFGGAYLAAVFLMDFVNPRTHPDNYKVLSPAIQNLVNAVGATPYSPHDVSLGLALIISLLFFAFISLAWAFVRGDTRKATDVRLSDVARMYGKTKKKNVRKCR